MSWRTLFRRASSPPADPTACSFCRLPRAQVKHLVAGTEAAICDACVVLAGAVIDESAPATEHAWARVVTAMATTCPKADAHRIVEPLTRAACALLAAHPDEIRAFAHLLYTRQAAPFARAAMIAFTALGADQLTIHDAELMQTAALLAGEFEIAARSRPANPDEANDPVVVLSATLVPLLRMRPGDPSIEEQVTRARAAAQQIGTPVSEDVQAVVLTTLGLAELRSGRAAAALVYYAPYRNNPALRPWHLLALGDAMYATGKVAEAQAIWSRLADDADVPYWSDEARGRVASPDAPYR